MKGKRILAIIVGLVLVMAMMLSACSKEPETLENYISKDSEAADQINEAADSAGLDVQITGNDVIYTYDLKNFEGLDAELAKSETMINSLTQALESSGTTFTSLCSQLEEESKIEGIRIIVNYNYDGETLVTKTFDASGVVEE